MSKFLITVCAFGLLLSAASAQQQWTDEELREGVQRTEYTRQVPSGAKRTLENLGVLNPDCSVPEGYEAKVTKQPEHGSAEIVSTQSFPQYPKDNVPEVKPQKWTKWLN